MAAMALVMETMTMSRKRMSKARKRSTRTSSWSGIEAPGTPAFLPSKLDQGPQSLLLMNLLTVHAVW